MPLFNGLFSNSSELSTAATSGPSYNSASEIPYSLVESRIRVHGSRLSTSDPYDGTHSSVNDIHVELLNVAERGGPSRRLRTGQGSQDFSVQLTPDGRLQSLQYKQVGAGPTVASAAAKLLGFVASTALAVAKLGSPASQGESPAGARDDWQTEYPDAYTLLEANKSLSKNAADKLVALRLELIDAEAVAESRSLLAKAHQVEAVLESARVEIGRLEAMYVRWRSAKTVSSSATIELYVGLDEISSRDQEALSDEPPPVPEEGTRGFKLWEDFGIVLELVDVDWVKNAGHTAHGPATPEAGNLDLDLEARWVRWRVPRPAELWVWAANKAANDQTGDVVLVTRTPLRISDKNSALNGMELRLGAFGEHGGSWIFNDDGSLGAVTTSDQSTIKAFAEALSNAPDVLLGAVQQAKTLTDAVGGIQDAAAERQKAAAERELATAKARMDLLGVNATAADVATLARAEQDVKLRTATRAIGPRADALDDLKLELDERTTRETIAAQQRSAAIAAELADLKAEVARLEQDVLVAKARRDITDPPATGASSAG